MCVCVDVCIFEMKNVESILRETKYKSKWFRSTLSTNIQHMNMYYLFLFYANNSLTPVPRFEFKYSRNLYCDVIQTCLVFEKRTCEDVSFLSRAANESCAISHISVSIKCIQTIIKRTNTCWFSLTWNQNDCI